MRPLCNDPRDFKEEMLIGLVSAYGRYLERVPGAYGVARVGGPRRDKVSVVIGGGAGHYPAFSGLVGAGLADGAVVGDIFTSPSAEQAERVARALDGGAGILYSFGNYAGDVLNFGLAEQRLVASGIGCRTVLVTDDVASAPAGERHLRRGIAGTLVVFKAAGAAAARGERLGEVERLARLANARTVTLGVGFAGCTVPGRQDPLFSVDAGTIEIGLGIHGEPGISTGTWLPARDLALALSAPLLAERPAGASRAAVLLNGLGATKYEELFVVWGAVAALLGEAGVEIVLPEVGEFVTSLDMSGCSLTICWLDDELAELWRAPADAPGFRRGDPGEVQRFEPLGLQQSRDGGRPAVTRPASVRSRRDAAVVRAALAAMLATIEEHEQELGRLDAVAGDGDHGSGMVRGLRAALAAAGELGRHTGPGTALLEAGRAWADRAGGTSGSLWGLLLETLGEEIGDVETPSGPAVARAVRKGAQAVEDSGGAQLGDKTLLDALWPFVDALGELAPRHSVGTAWSLAAVVADTAAAATAALRPKVGRARPLADRSLGSPDPGAVSLALCLNAVGTVLVARTAHPRARAEHGSPAPAVSGA